MQATLQSFEELRAAKYDQIKQIWEKADLDGGTTGNTRKYKEMQRQMEQAEKNLQASRDEMERRTEEARTDDDDLAQPIQTGEGVPDANIAPELAASAASAQPLPQTEPAPAPVPAESGAGTTDARAVKASVSIDLSV